MKFLGKRRRWPLVWRATYEAMVEKAYEVTAFKNATIESLMRDKEALAKELREVRKALNDAKARAGNAGRKKGR